MLPVSSRASLLLPKSGALEHPPKETLVSAKAKVKNRLVEDCTSSSSLRSKLADERGLSRTTARRRGESCWHDNWQGGSSQPRTCATFIFSSPRKLEL